MRTIVKVVAAENSFEFLKPEDMPEETRARIKTYSDLLDYRMTEIADPVDRVLVRNKFDIDSLRKDYSDRGMLSHQYRVRDAGGAVRWNIMSASVYTDQFDGRTYAFIRTKDITFRRSLEESLEKPITRDSTYMSVYTIEMLGSLSDAFLSSPDCKGRSAVVLFTIRNHDFLLEQHGRIMLIDMLGGFVGKIMMIVDNEHLTCYDGKRTIVLFIPDAGAEAALYGLAEKILKYLRNPAYFQFHEEVFMDFSCGISVTDGETTRFSELYDKASRALRSLDEQNDRHIAFFS
jgi:GGDEF domain-containing protein